MNKNINKIILGQFFTKKHFWTHKHILDFIEKSKTTIAFDPFAGAGDLLNNAHKFGFKHIVGYDIDPSLNWEFNDSLKNVPSIPNSIIITNPPYLTNYSAKRKGIYEAVSVYFENCNYDDLYQLAIEKCMENNKFGVMIVPETFINSSFPKRRINNITIIEDSMFEDTSVPICVICFDNKIKNYDEIKIFKNDVYINTLGNLERMRKIPYKKLNIVFNSLSGNIALRAVDTTKVSNQIKFMVPRDINYNLSTIKVSSRLITLINIDVEDSLVNEIIEISNQILFDFRNATSDILLSPFKGNNEAGKRRRRLDYLTARAIIEEAYERVSSL